MVYAPRTSGGIRTRAQISNQQTASHSTMPKVSYTVSQIGKESSATPRAFIYDERMKFRPRNFPWQLDRAFSNHVLHGISLIDGQNYFHTDQRFLEISIICNFWLP